MAKNNGKRPKDRLGASKIRKAERKLAEALSEVDEARAKVARRERKLSALLAKHRPVESDAQMADDEGQVDQAGEEGQADEDADDAVAASEPADDGGERDAAG